MKMNDPLIFRQDEGTALPGPYRIVLADDHVGLRHWLKKTLSTKPDLEVLGEAADGRELLDFLGSSTLTPHMVILDISMPNMQGIEAARRIKTAYPDIKVLFLTVHREKEYLYHAVAAGADGYLLKDDMDEQLFPAIEAIRRGKAYVSPPF
jgi:DNA-binding NarL/FixJ family response regulator